MSVDPRFERFVLAELACGSDARVAATVRTAPAFWRSGCTGAATTCSPSASRRAGVPRGSAGLRGCTTLMRRGDAASPEHRRASRTRRCPRSNSLPPPVRISHGSPAGPDAHAGQGAGFGGLSRARGRARGDRGPSGRSAARRRDADRALSPARSMAGDVNRYRVIAAARTGVTNGPRPRRRDHAGVVEQRLVTAWAWIPTIERGSNNVGRGGAVCTDHVGHTIQTRSPRDAHQASGSVPAIRRADGGKDPS